jgi:hypothetical protein
MDSVGDTACAVGCPIRRSRDQRLLASPPGLSQRATSFIASQCQGIHQMPLITRLSTTPNGKDQTALRQCRLVADAANFSLEDTVGHNQPPAVHVLRHDHRYAGRALLGHVTYSLFTYSISKTPQKCHHFSREFGTSYRVVTDASPLASHQKSGGGERDRTDDLLLAKQALSQLSYTPGSGRHFCHLKWWAREDLNLRPHAYQARALTS